ncbi:MAG: hypothetical protein J7L80_02870 [Thermoplasmata archaeon]|nr:hypothetical protein [Thermoplasmata archaeon]
MKSIAYAVFVIFVLSSTMTGFVNNEVNTIEVKESITTYEGYDLLILTPQQFYDALIPFKEHKENHGIRTIIVTLDEVYNGEYFPCQGRDDAEKVKYFIKNAYDEWHIKYVLLVGGRKPGLKEEWWMPVRYVYLDDRSNWERRYLSDLYFADLYDKNGSFSSWDNNGN